MDTLEHITDFDSATDHTLSYAKWREMSIPMYTEPTAKTGTGSNYGAPPRLTAFNPNTDNTIIHESDKRSRSSFNSLPLGYDRATRIRAQRMDVNDKPVQSRWKYEGPDLVSMTQSEFESFVRSEVALPKIQEEFRQFLWTVLEWRNKQDADIEASRKGQQAAENTEQETTEQDPSVHIPSREQFQKWMMELRSAPQNLSTELSKLIRDFFDLPPFPEEIKISQNPVHKMLTADLAKDTIPARTAPTHPSAGLSYIKTDAFMENHPEYGPQAERAPVQARLLRSRSGGFGFSDFSLVGVGGFSAKDRASKGAAKSDALANWHFAEQSKNKVWVKPHFAFVDANGKINLEIERAQEEPIAVAGGMPDPRKPVDDYNDRATREKFKVLTAAAAQGEQQSQSPAPAYRTLTPAKGYQGGAQKEFIGRMKAGLSAEKSVTGIADVLRQAMQEKSAY